ncbi:hypothetical protein [Clostridium beijerinckii]|uniref:REase associating with pPIWI RE domain-containing protein n=1 Tax=Clostridium beijerinckii TaxID=1520 RepID=A0A1S9N6K3_CLOBE|nr:hypothetical protein [Clostridium beijerinckii]OOP73196.1 hypothetical protein CBEIBR21_09170 [Clostridium beijerinckii]
MKKNVNLQEALCYLAIGIINIKNNFENRIYDIPYEYEKGTNMLFKYALDNKLKEFPLNFKEQFKLFSMPFNLWNEYKDIQSITEEFEFPLYDNGDVATCEEILEEFLGENKFRMKMYFQEELIFDEFKKLCNYEEYSIIRRFLIENIIVTSSRILRRSLHEKGIDNENLITFTEENLYELISDGSVEGGEIKVCNYCGYPLKYDQVQAGACSQRCSHILAQYLPKEQQVKRKGNLVLNRLFHLCIARPGIPEIEMYRKLEDLKKVNKILELSLYPEKDKYDIYVKLNSGTELMLDIKDYSNPKNLAYDLNRSGIVNKFNENQVLDIIIPDYRIQINTRYVGILKKRLSNDLKERLRIRTISEFIKDVEA